MRAIRSLVVGLLAACSIASAAEVARDDPINYDLRQYGFILGIALLGGLVSWHRKVRQGHVQYANLKAMVGELATSAFAGLMAFWACRYVGLHPALEAAVVGMVGHMGARALDWGEEVLRKRADRMVGKDGQ
jgi:hypothetical protein